MKTPLVTAICLTLLALALFVSPDHFSRSGVTTGQTRRTRPAGTSKAAPTGVDYAKFSHAEEKHKGACNTCHKVPTENAQKVRGYPDVADYPDHDACVTCHRKQFFSTAQPVICSDCHKKTSPRSGDRYDAFRNPDRPRQF